MTTEKTPALTPTPATTARKTGGPHLALRAPANWLRFWVKVAVAMVVFNIVAAIVTAYFIWPHLHPAG